MAGSFPRSFVVPGTEVSLRVGGQGVGIVVWYMKGSAVGGALNGQGSFNETFVDGQGGTGNLPGIPLNAHTFSAGPARRSALPTRRSSEWDFSGKQSRVFLDARTPSPYGEVKAYIEFDFAASNTNTILNNNQGSVNGYIPRLRQGYATLGGLLMGQTQGTFTDNDSEPELLDFGGQTGTTLCRAHAAGPLHLSAGLRHVGRGRGREPEPQLCRAVRHLLYRHQPDPDLGFVRRA